MSGHATLSELDASKLSYSYTTSPREVPPPDSAAVWQQGNASDHMITVPWNSRTGWAAPKLEPYGPISVMPTASCLHYAIECFEGMKVYRGFDGKVRLFRPDKNASRMLRAAARITLPAFAPDELEKLITTLCSTDCPKWLPKERPGSFLYIRPTLISTTPSLAVKKPNDALLFIILCCFPPFDEPGGTLGPPSAVPATADAPASKPKKAGVRLLASEEDIVRAWPGGFGYAKLGANYGPSLVASAQAAAKGYDQILWLFGEQGLVTEAGSSNFFIIIRDKVTGREQLITAPLKQQLILPGVTRMSVIEIAQERLSQEMDVVERDFTIHEIIEASEEGRLVEAFASGTAFFIAPIGEIHYKGKDIDVPLSEGVTGPTTQKIRTWLREIIYGKVQHVWGKVVPEKEQ